MAVNQKAIKVLNKIFEAGFADEKEISAMTMDDILSMQGITVADTMKRLSPSMRTAPKKQRKRPKSSFSIPTLSTLPTTILSAAKPTLPSL